MAFSPQTRLIPTFTPLRPQARPLNLRVFTHQTSETGKKAAVPPGPQDRYPGMSGRHGHRERGRSVPDDERCGHMFVLELSACRLQERRAEAAVLREFHRKRVEGDVHAFPVQHVGLCDVGERLVEGAGVTLRARRSRNREVDGLPVFSIQFAHQRRQEECQFEKYQEVTHFRGM